MANTKISELPLFTGTPSDSDFLPIVDNSELTTKRILVSDLLINVPESGIDSATAQSIANAEIISTVDSAYVQSRQTTYGDADVTALVDAAYVQSRQIVYGDADVTSLVDSNYVQSLQIIPSSIDSEGVVSLITDTVDSAYVQALQIIPGNVDSGGIVSLITSTVDSAYVQSRVSFETITGVTQNVTIEDLLGNPVIAIDSDLATASNLVVTGDLQVNGTTTTVNAENLEVTDNMIYMNAGESAGSPTAFIDVGFAANVNETGVYTHTGFFRDASDNGTWKLFDGYGPEPDASVQIDTSHPSFSLANFSVDTMTANSFVGSGSLLTGMFDSADVIGIVDSDYVQSRVVLDGVGIDSATSQSIADNRITTLVDSAYVQSRVTLDGVGIDSAAVLGLIDQAAIQNLRDSGTGIYVTGDLTVESDFTVLGTATVSGFDIGIQSDSVTGLGNIAIGEDVLINLTSGNNNIVFGYLAGTTITTGSNNILIGFDVNATDSVTSNEIVLGNDSNDRLRIPGLGLDTNDATHGQYLLWDSSTDALVWSTPSSGIQNLRDSDNGITVTGRLTVDSDLVVNGNALIGGYEFVGISGAPNDGDLLSWDSAADQLSFVTPLDNAAVIALVDSAYVQSRVTLDGVGLDSAGVVTVLNNASVGEFEDTYVSTLAVVMGIDAANIRFRPTAVPSNTTAVGIRAANALSSGTDNTAIGDQSLEEITTGSYNTAVGSQSLDGMTTQSFNTAVGSLSMFGAAQTSSIAIGYEAGYSTGAGSNNVFIGNQSAKNQGGSGAGHVNNIVIGYQATMSASNTSNEITLGNNSIDRLRIPGLGLDTNDAVAGQFLTFDGTNFTFDSVAAGSVSSGFDSADVVALVDSDYVQSRQLGVGLSTTTTTVASLTQTTIYSFAASLYSGAKVVVTATDGSNRHATELLITHDGATAVATEYATITTAGSLSTFDVDLTGGNVTVLATNTSTNSTQYNVIPILI